MFNLSGDALIDGYIRFETETNTSGVIGFLDYGTTDGAALSAVEAQGEGYSNLVFSQVVEGGSFYTGLALLNPNNEPSIVTLDVFDTGGNRTGSAIVNLDSGEREAGLLSDFLQSNVNQFGGFVRITATRPIFALELFGSRNATFLASVPAQGESLKPQTSGSLVDAAAGANVISNDGSTSLLIPSMALKSNSSIKVEPISVSGLPLVSGGLQPISAVEATPAGTQFQIPVRLTFPVNANLDPGTKIPLVIFDPQTLTYQPTEFVATVDNSGRTASAEVTHFTQYVASVAGTLLTISNITPSTVKAGDTITITGNSFCSARPQNSVTFAGANNTSIQGSVLSISSASIQAQVPSGAVSGPVVVDSCQTTSTGYSITVVSPNPAPGTISLSLSWATVGTLSVSEGISGTGFITNSVVNYDGVAIPTTFVNSTLLKVTLGPFTSTGIHHLNVVNPAPGGGTSNTVDFTVMASTTTITSFTPTTGPTGTSVTISGTNFTGATAVLFNGVSASFTVTSATAIQATVPAGATTGPLKVTTPGGTATSASSFTVRIPPTITGFTPTSGPIGTSVTISGTNFTGATAVRFNGVSASFTVSSATAIQATVPAGATTGPLKVTTPGGTATSASSFTVRIPPTITGFTPTSGPIGTSVTISGTNFTGATAVLFNGVSASFTVSSATAIQATVPAGATTGPLKVTTPGGTATSASSFTVSIPPTITSFTPTTGPAGTSVTISGTNFTGATAIRFNGVSATFTVSSATAIQATVPAGATTGPLKLPTPGGTATSASSFTVSIPPTITSFTPTTGPAGTSVTISGTNFTGATAVRFNGVSATFTVSSATVIQATVPAGATTGPLKATTRGGAGTRASTLT